LQFPSLTPPTITSLSSSQCHSSSLILSLMFSSLKCFHCFCCFALNLNTPIPSQYLIFSFSLEFFHLLLSCNLTVSDTIHLLLIYSTVYSMNCYDFTIDSAFLSMFVLVFFFECHHKVYCIVHFSNSHLVSSFVVVSMCLICLSLNFFWIYRIPFVLKTLDWPLEYW
jgi:hypothetical protein